MTELVNCARCDCEGERGDRPGEGRIVSGGGEVAFGAFSVQLLCDDCADELMAEAKPECQHAGSKLASFLPDFQGIESEADIEEYFDKGLDECFPDGYCAQCAGTAREEALTEWAEMQRKKAAVLYRVRFGDGLKKSEITSAIHEIIDKAPHLAINNGEWRNWHASIEIHRDDVEWFEALMDADERVLKYEDV